MSTRTSLLLALNGVLVLLVLVTCWAGLRGSFLFDDFANLPALGATGPVNNLDSFVRYVTSGTADPLGRPLVLLSFLLDARDWPATPLPFKRTNLFLHALISLMLVQLLRRLGQALPQSQTIGWRIELAALLGGALWATHPLWISTTFYIVQREAMLPALFTVCGLMLWLRGRRAFVDDQIWRGTFWLFLGLGACTLLAALCKANGVLLPVLALIIEITWLRAVAPVHRRGEAALRLSYQKVMWVLAGAPTAFVLGYLLYQGWIGFAHGISSARPWTLGQRLLTEPRILLHYLDLLWIPRPFTPGLFNDQIRASASLWAPASTALSLLAIVAMITGACVLRRRLPAVALSILFFFTGHLIESTTIPLELYFEHRNYLPALLMFWPLALWICGVPQAFPGQDKSPPATALRQSQRGWAMAGLVLVLLAGLAWMTHVRAALWGNIQEQALLWAKLNPQSPRAQVNAAQVEIQSGHPERAAQRLSNALDRSPDELQIALNLLAAKCDLGDLDPDTEHAAIRALQTTQNAGSLLAHWFDRAIDKAAAPPCLHFDFALIKQMLDAARANPALASQSGPRQDIDHLQGRLALARHEQDAALVHFNEALDDQVRATVAFQQAALLGSAGYPTQGLAHLDHYQQERDKEGSTPFGMPRIHAWVLDRQHYWDAELYRLRNTLRADQRAQGDMAR